MRYAPEHKTATRKRLLDKAGALVKRQGFGTTGVDALVGAAGLTAGAFYSHFGSKAELLEAVIEQEMARSQRLFEVETREALLAATGRYLSAAHVDQPERGCALPTLSAEVARADEPVRATFERLLVQIKTGMQAHVGDEDQAWSLIAQSVGAVLLARAMASQPAREAVLGGVQRQIAKVLAQPVNKPKTRDQRCKGSVG